MGYSTYVKYRIWKCCFRTVTTMRQSKVLFNRYMAYTSRHFFLYFLFGLLLYNLGVVEFNCIADRIAHQAYAFQAFDSWISNCVPTWLRSFIEINKPEAELCNSQLIMNLCWYEQAIYVSMQIYTIAIRQLTRTHFLTFFFFCLWMLSYILTLLPKIH